MWPCTDKYMRTDAQTAVVMGCLLRSRCGHSHTDMHVCNYSFKLSSLTNLRNWTPRQQVAGQPVISCKDDRLNTLAAGSGNAEDCFTGSVAHQDRQQDTLLLTRRRFLLGSATAAGSLGTLPLPPQHPRLLSLSAIVILRSVSLSATGLLISYHCRRTGLPVPPQAKATKTVNLEGEEDLEVWEFKIDLRVVALKGSVPNQWVEDFKQV